MADVFVSYASGDRDRVRPLVDTLESAGLSVWWDTRINLGSSFDREIESQLEQAVCVVVVWSHNSIESDWVREEASEGLERGVLVPVLIDDCRLPLGFRRAQTGSLIGWPESTASIDKIVSRIADLVSQASQTSTLDTLPETRYATSGDLSIAYQVLGDGPRDLIYVPGIVSHVEFFHELPGYSEFLKGLAGFARVIVFDKRGNGLSDRISGAPSVAERMEDVTAVMEAVGSERAVLFGVSEGGPISLLFAATYPEKVEAIVLYETFVQYGGVPGHTWVWEMDAHQKFTEAWMPLYGTGVSIAGFGSSYAHDKDVQAMWGRAERLSNSPGGFREVYAALRETDVHAALPSVQAPCLVICSQPKGDIRFGEVSRNNPQHAEALEDLEGVPSGWFLEHSEYLATHLPNARLLKLEGVDHFPWFAGCDRIVASVEEFVTGSTGRTDIDADRVLATLLFIDIAESTGKHEPAEVDDQAFQALVWQNIGRFRGIEADPGDARIFVRFDSPARAVLCACALRDGANTLGMSARVGVHTGEIELAGDEVKGLAVHVADSVMIVAEPDEVLVSRTVKDLIVGSEFSFRERGDHRFNGVPQVCTLFAVDH